MADFLLPSLAVAAAVLLLGAGATHLAHPGRLRVALDRQDLVRQGFRRHWPCSWAVSRSPWASPPRVALVTDTGAAATGLVVRRRRDRLRAFLLALLRLRPGAPCGCDGE